MNAQDWVEHVVGYAVAWDDTAAWVQAFGSIIAILVSAAFAVWVPVQMHHRDQKLEVQRAVNTLSVGIGMTVGSIEALAVLLKESSPPIEGHGANLINSSVANARKAMASVPEGMHLGAAFTAMTLCEVLLNSVESVLNAVVGGADRDAAIAVLNELQPECAEVSALGASLKPKKIEGCWMIYAPDDEADILEVKRRRRPAIAKRWKPRAR